MADGGDVTILIADEAALSLLAEDVAMALRKGDVIALYGDLGAGKTTFARYVLRALADDPELEVPSPTFTLAQGYDFGRLAVTHFDLYRLADPDELEEVGLDEAMLTGAALIEWPDRAEGRLPADRLELTLAERDDPNARTVTLSAPSGSWKTRLERSLSLRRFLDDVGWTVATRRFLQGDASTRTYERIRRDDQNAVAMNAPAQPDGPPVQDGLPYSRIAHLAEDVRPFVAVGETLRNAGFSTPEVLAADLDAGFLLLEDLGANGVVDDKGPIAERYLAAVEVLAALHGGAWPNEIALADGTHHRVPPYDRRALTIEISLLLDWYIPHVTGAPADASTREAFFAAWEGPFEALSSAETSWVLRDFHSPNLIWLPERDDIARIGLLDYQDALVGPAAYDVASLSQDARITVPKALEVALLNRYVALRRKQDAGFDEAGFRTAHAIMAAQRATKVLGIFARLNDRDGKPAYLKHFPRLKNYLKRSLKHPVLSAVRLWYDSVLQSDLKGPSGS
ncbi:hypothetical protein GGD81_002616 [Rhodobium orientis]|uniref:tRNA threonylcarbamoyladenosine biosynthesis protein TsaE n=1 Tax=Rhodobium orientis TaxID=34017 RepID=A0A327JE96_9HYPH|nr:tRNA (adenosine(37)-N6)-threonylcarbamoyltransferase complex ATPase subunit type 1 TsaE [Rhodobium orientis]MBB4303573.1 hypothetical protein [Rhodobium orientis]MBK5950502.1 tRNA (adenosine(37)-N6)-threonylcarbamoyltransferase complex ATPase subunit type 1 TsaE [Rhodobium orientis]RAI24258.1 tRNA (adenosine(37)-N6)-threonylcarbamoyltransferase complex ATPase subunit type 1 TsaE [Rhodobium orientis]